jgi:hypothetical protein
MRGPHDSIPRPAPVADGPLIDAYAPPRHSCPVGSRLLASAAVAAVALFAGCMAKETPTAPDAALVIPAEDAGEDPIVRIDAGVECAAFDRDGDGYGTGPACPQLDCDDTNALVHPGAPEACNGEDDDCDQAIDEDLGEGSCGRGACRRTAPFCAGGRAAVCTPAPPAAAELCNRVDDDCDGMVDEDVPTTTCGTGACVRSAACVDGAIAACVPGPPAPETCNRIDDDCNGTADEGFRARAIVGTYTELTQRHPGCTAGGERLGPNCNAAMHRACAQQGCTTTGFGPVENSGDTSVYTCVVAAEEVTVPYATLATAHADCDGARQRIGPACNAAIHRYCAGRGHATGFGPAESGADAALVQCLSSAVATPTPTTYSVLATHHAGCDGSTQARRIGSDCNAAIHRYCASRGHTSGFGPLENSGDDALVACVSP